MTINLLSCYKFTKINRKHDLMRYSNTLDYIELQKGFNNLNFDLMQLMYVYKYAYYEELQCHFD